MDEPGTAEVRCPARIYPLKVPQGHKPPVPRYSAALQQTGTIAVLFVGVQSRDPGVALGADFGALCDGPLAPSYVDHAVFTDPAGYTNKIAALYWLKGKDFAPWLDTPAVCRWRCRFSEASDAGMWWEPIVVGATRAETIAFKEFRRGFSGCPMVDLETTQGSGYWGAARDRIPGSAYDLFEPTFQTMTLRADSTLPGHQAVKPLKNMTIIRSGVSWEHCQGEQLDDYEQRISPKLDAGMEYLRNHPVETGCFTLRQVNSVSSNGISLAEGYSLGTFVSLAHLESWAKDHPSHLAIYTRAMAARKKYQDALQLRTYNEIFVIDDDNPPFEYFGCHPKTGLLPYSHLRVA